VTSHFYFTDKRGITQGVDSWDNRDATNLKDSNKDIASPRTVPRAIEKLRALAAAKRRFVLFVHLFEPHSTYVTHPGTEYRITERGVQGLQQKYDMEVKFTDVWLGKLLGGLRAARLEERTAVIVFGDHAEAFGEHKLYFHGQTLYDEVLHVPLLLRLPRGPRRVVRERVALLDLAPTVLELMGAAVPESFQGRSLLPLARGEAGPPDRRIGAVLMAYPAWPKAQRALHLGRHKIIFHVTDNRYEIYDLEADPRESRDLAGVEPALADRLRKELTRFTEQELQ
jgi:arylsulfatase A-like enzyme